MTQNKPIKDVLAELLTHEERRVLDFKSADYLLKGDHPRGEFLKDILAMVNTPRDESAFIVLGVEKKPGLAPVVVGLPQCRDERYYQDAIRDKISPTPQLVFHAVDWEGKTVGLLELPCEQKGPFLARADLGAVNAGVIYWRRGSTTAPVVDSTDYERVVGWHRGSTLAHEAPSSSPEWQRFCEFARIDEIERVFVLAAWRLSPDVLQVADGLSAAPWLAVIDFDTGSDVSGLLAALRPRLQRWRRVHEVVLGDKPSINPEHATYWYFAAGQKSRAKTMPSQAGYKPWVHMYGRDLGRQIESVAEKVGLLPVTVVFLVEGAAYGESRPFFRNVINEAYTSFGDRVRFAICTSRGSVENTDFEEFGGAVQNFELAPEDLARGAERAFSSDGRLGDVIPWEIPGRAGIPVQVESDKRPWLEEELEILHSHSGIAEPPDAGAFLRGRQVSWPELAHHDDVERDTAPRIQQQLRVDLGLTPQQSPGTLRHSLYHEPGAGGTTLARRLVWNLRNDVPCVVVKRSTPLETADRIRYIHDLTALPVLILVEGRDVGENQIDELYTHLKSQAISCVILQVFRGFYSDGSSRQLTRDRNPRANNLQTKLSTVEAALFAERFSRATQGRRVALERLAKADGSERQPFFFGLYAFNENFTGLRSFVSERLIAASPEQRRILLFLSLAYHYGHSSLSPQMFATDLGVPVDESVDLVKALLPKQLGLLVREGTHWRPAHDVLGLEIIRQILNPAGGDPRVWKQNLAERSLEFARFCRGTVNDPSDEVVGIIHRTFLLRESRSYIGREGGNYAKLIEDIPSVDDRLHLLNSLAEIFPNDAHIWAHLGRFVYRERDPGEALRLIDRSIELSPDDPLLYHMKGMALRELSYQALRAWKEERTDEALAKAIGLMELAAEQFGKSREGASHDEHGYVSHIQMLLQLLETAQMVFGGGELGRARVRESAHAFLRDALDSAEGLLELVRLMQEGERASEYVLKCAADLDAIYGNFSAALQAWDSLLSRQGVYKPTIRRQIVRAHLSRSGRRWSDIPQDSLRRLVDLLDQNILEEPGEERNVRMWVQAVRRLSPPQPIERVAARVGYWKANSNSVDAAFYLYVLHMLRAIEGSVTARREAEDALVECKRRSRMQRNRQISFEWLGPGTGMRRLVHQSELGMWDESQDFWRKSDLLSRVTGRVISIRGPEAGDLELPGGVVAFFIPGRAKILKGRDENARVTLFLGFAYDGPRAWEVKLASSAHDDQTGVA